MNPFYKRAVVAGGTRGLGLGVVEALVAAGVAVRALARTGADLAALERRLGVETLVGDAADPDVARRALAARPDLVILNAGSEPPMGRIDQLSWEDFCRPWSSDTQAAFHFTQAALQLPLAPGSLVVLTSSGAAVQGSPLSGGYGPAKRASWYLARYADALSRQRGLGIRFRVVAPQQLVAGTGVGDTGLRAYAALAGKSPEDFAKNFPVLPPRQYGELLIALLRDRADDGLVFGLRGGAEPTVLEPLPQ